MATMTLGVFSDRRSAEAAINDLERAGYNPKEMSFVMKDQAEAQSVAENTGVSVGEGAVSGATTGGVIGGIAGLLIGIGAIAVPGIGALLIGGPLAAALGLTGAAATTVSGAVTGALAGGLVGALVNLGIPKEEAQVYQDRVQAGGVLLAVPADPVNGTDSRTIMANHGADQVRSITVDTMNQPTI